MVEGSLNLVAWKTSGCMQLQEAFQNTLPNSFLSQEGQAPRLLTTAPGINGHAGVLAGKSTHFRPLGDIVNFLGEQHQKGYQYSTINGYRSAISAIHPEVDGVKVGQHQLVVQLMKGVFNDRPPQPKYTSTWDVSLVLDYIRGLGDNAIMPITSLTQKVAMLMAITGACRGSELKALDPTLMSDKGDSIVFHIAHLTKTKRQSKPHHSVTFERCEDDSLLDVIQAIQAYLTRTKDWRQSFDQKHQLLLATVEPHQPVVSSTIAHWLTAVMRLAGVDVSVYKAHSTRAASTSKAKAEGLSVDQIVQRGNWSKVHTFKRFYDKDIPDRSFTKAVLK